MSKQKVVKMCGQSSIIPLILSMLFFFMILLVLFQNCSFSIGCGGNHSLVKDMIDHGEFNREMFEMGHTGDQVNSKINGYSEGSVAAGVGASNSLLQQ